MALNYDKWDHIDDSDDEARASDKRVQPLLESTKQQQQRDADAAVAERFAAYLRKHLKQEYPLAKRKLAAQFIGAQHRGESVSNIFRYNDICSFVARYSDELSDRSTTSMLCELHKRLIATVPSAELKNESNAIVKDCQTLIEAINALEACAQQGNAVIFYETVCNPSSSERARKLTERYERKEFAKRAMMKHLFKEDPSFGDNDFDDEEIPIGSSARKGKPKGSSFEDGDLYLLFAFVIAASAMVVGIYFYAHKLMIF
ncbi:hypothetical protein AB1Y20_000931 [Prymnesium parvum]|uniref:Uncharacterized protein n=1 Tax=Prymnesium parvum TaxID=97485 RepID=A0AB34KC31_PRYPA